MPDKFGRSFSIFGNALQQFWEVKTKKQISLISFVTCEKCDNDCKKSQV